METAPQQSYMHFDQFRRLWEGGSRRMPKRIILKGKAKAFENGKWVDTDKRGDETIIVVD